MFKKKQNKTKKNGPIFPEKEKKNKEKQFLSGF